MTTFVFGLEDLARTRFAISPMWEAISSIRALRSISEDALLLPWFERVRPALRELDLAEALALHNRHGYIPDFTSPPPTTPLAVFEEELELVRATPAALVRNDMGALARQQYGGKLPEILTSFVEHPRAATNRLAKTLAAYWETAIEPFWPRVHALLRADIDYRARCLTEGGPEALFADLHPTVTWDGSELEIRQKWCGRYELEGRSLLLVPSAFGWQFPSTLTEDPWQPTLFYPARGVATLWEPGAAEAPEALGAVLGSGRAAVLSALDAPATSGELARRLGVTAGSVSQHVGSLRAAGLVASERDGRHVLHARTGLADQLVTGAA
jgi:biotin operon repressor